MPLDFPASPSVNDTYTFSGRTWKWNGSGWQLTSDGVVGTTNIANDAVTSAKIADGTIVDGDISGSAEIAVSKLADGTARQLLQTDAAGTGVEWTSNVDIPGTLDVTGATTLDSTLSFPLGSAGSPSLYPSSDTNTGIWSPAADTIAVSTGGVERFRSSTSEVVFNEGGVDCDFRIEGDTNANLFVVDAGTDEVRVANINGGPLAGFRNAIINGNFDIWQRGTSFTGSEYGADRWFNARGGSACTMSRQAFTLGQTDVPGEPTYFCRMAVTSVAGAGNYAVPYQRIEDVRSFAGQQITVSFWAKADASRPITIELSQGFGTGGSPSAEVTAIGVTKTTLSTSWQKVSVTTTVPSISGKTLGSDNNHFFTFAIWLDAGSNFNSRTSSLGQQSGTFDIAQVQVERGPVATPFERRPIGTELALCQRYYETGDSAIMRSSATAGAYGGAITPVQLVKKRATPTFSINVTASSGAPNVSSQSITDTRALVYFISSTAVDSYAVFGWTASAEI